MKYLSTISVRVFLTVCLSVFMWGCSSLPHKPAPHPYENLLTIMADCRRALSTDIYRFPYPVDISGQNIYKSSLVHLANYERLYPGRFTEALTFMRARLYERLGDYTQASHNYLQVTAMNGEMSSLAEERLAIAKNFETIATFTIHAKNAEEYMQEYEAKLASLDTLIARCAGQDTEPLARLEKEKAEVDYAVFLQDYRHLLQDGTKRAVEKWKAIIKEHEQSKNLPSHKIHLADFYFTLAREYVTWVPPERIGFEWGVFENFAIPARDMYYQVSLMDGYPEKLEGRGKLESILAFMETVRKRSR